jgi:endonuclease/exonuclease/phosphatase family metal-dependent hydrolase
MQFIKHLHFNPLNINFDIRLSGIKNYNFRMINFYLNNKIDNKQIDDIKNLSLKKNQVKIMSLNVHNLKSINLNDTPISILQNLLDFIEKINVDICFLQEFYTNLQIKNKKYNYIKNNDHIGLVILYKNLLKIKNINFFKLNNESKFDQRRFCLHFELNNKKFSTTHLEIGKRFYDRNGILYNPKELYEVINFNYKLRKNQIKQILEDVPEPDFIIGDFNFNSLDKEFEYLTNKKKYYTGLVDYTTPFEKQVDFIFSKKPYKFFRKIKYPYSDHLPVIAIVDT